MLSQGRISIVSLGYMSDIAISRRAFSDEVGIWVSQITEKAQLAQSTISSFVRSLEREHLVISTRVGKRVHGKRNEE